MAYHNSEDELKVEVYNYLINHKNTDIDEYLSYQGWTEINDIHFKKLYNVLILELLKGLPKIY